MERYAFFTFQSGVDQTETFAVPVTELDGVGVGCLALEFPKEALDRSSIAYPYSGMAFCDGVLLPVLANEAVEGETTFARRVIYGSGVALAIAGGVRVLTREKAEEFGAKFLSWKETLKYLLGQRMPSENANEKNEERAA